MLALNLLPGTGLGCFSLGALLEAFLLCAQQRNLNIVSVTQVVPMQLWPKKNASCRVLDKPGSHHCKAGSNHVWLCGAKVL